MSLGFGNVARVGHLYPSGGLCDYEIQLMAPSGVQFLTTRLPFRNTGVSDDLALADDLEFHAGLLADAAVELIAFNCTAASMLIGPENIRRRILDSTGLPSVSTIEAVTDALREVHATRILLLNPYPRTVESIEIQHFQDAGFNVVASRGPSCSTPVEQGSIPPQRWLEETMAFDFSSADAILLSCAGTQSAAVHAQIEAASGLPLITSNQALLWSVLRELGIDHDLPEYGKLLTATSRLECSL